jgi:hypothetical protein
MVTAKNQNGDSYKLVMLTAKKTFLVISNGDSCTEKDGGRYKTRRKGCTFYAGNSRDYAIYL